MMLENKKIELPFWFYNKRANLELHIISEDNFFSFRNLLRIVGVSNQLICMRITSFQTSLALVPFSIVLVLNTAYTIIVNKTDAAIWHFRKNRK